MDMHHHHGPSRAIQLGKGVGQWTWEAADDVLMIPHMAVRAPLPAPMEPAPGSEDMTPNRSVVIYWKGVLWEPHLAYMSVQVEHPLTLGQGWSWTKQV